MSAIKCRLDTHGQQMPLERERAGAAKPGIEGRLADLWLDALKRRLPDLFGVHNSTKPPKQQIKIDKDKSTFFKSAEDWRNRRVFLTQARLLRNLWAVCVHT